MFLFVFLSQSPANTRVGAQCEISDYEARELALLVNTSVQVQGPE